jgi:hypothetical protein
MTKTTKKNSAINIIVWLTDLQSKRETWENGAYKTSNDELYRILASCLDIYQQLLHSDKRDDRKELTARLTQLGYKMTESTPLATKVIRYVFKTDRKRSHTYSRVITCAHHAGIDAVRLPRWIEQCGGIEEVRRIATSGVSNAQRTATLVSLAEDLLSSQKPVVTLTKPSAEFRPETGSVRRYSLALVRLEDDGTCAVVYGINNGPLLKKVLERAGRELEERKLKADSNSLKSENALKRAEAIALAA